jgi:hypothetical protein
MSLATIGFKFLMCPSRRKGVWYHPAEARAHIAAGWTDCTGMTDAEYDAFMGVA